MPCSISHVLPALADPSFRVAHTPSSTFDMLALGVHGVVALETLPLQDIPLVLSCYLLLEFLCRSLAVPRPWDISGLPRRA